MKIKTGKSCTSIVIGEALKNSTSSRIIYSVPAPLIDQYFEEIAGEIRNGKFFSCPSFCVTKNSDDELKRDFYVSETKNKTLVEMQKKMQKEIIKLDELEELIEIDDSPINKKKFLLQQRKVLKNIDILAIYHINSNQPPSIYKYLISNRI